VHLEPAALDAKRPSWLRCSKSENGTFGPDTPGRRCPLTGGEEQKFAARCQSDAIDPKGGRHTGSPEEVRKLAMLFLGALSFQSAFAIALGKMVIIAGQHLAECAQAH
jgi:hypothetical protein